MRKIRVIAIALCAALAGFLAGCGASAVSSQPATSLATALPPASVATQLSPPAPTTFASPCDNPAADCNEAGTPPAASSATTQESRESPATEVASEGGIGQRMHAGDFDITVSSVQYVGRIGTNSANEMIAPPGKVFAVVSFTLTNTSDTVQKYDNDPAAISRHYTRGYDISGHAYNISPSTYIAGVLPWDSQPGVTVSVQWVSEFIMESNIPLDHIIFQQNATTPQMRLNLSFN